VKRILIAYATLAGSTVEVAQAVARELQQQGLLVDVLSMGAVKSLAGYDGVVVGAPMLMGWHRGALGFLHRHRAALRRLPLAVFVLAMSLTEPAETSLGSVPIFVDENLPKPPRVAGQPTFRERYTRLANYARPILSAARPAAPVSLAFFGGRLEYGRLPWWGVLFAMLVIQAPAGDRRNWPAIRAWAAGLPAAMHFTAPAVELPQPEPA
jgi:menaquinone-dependent protoporphyrinogen oxidase